MTANNPQDGSASGSTTKPSSAQIVQSAVSPSTMSLPHADGAKAVLPSASQWNTNSLAWRVGVDAASAMTAAVAICPIITVMDR